MYNSEREAHFMLLSCLCALFPPSGHLKPPRLVFLQNVHPSRRRCIALLSQTSTSNTAKANRVTTAPTAAIQGCFTALRASVEPTPASPCLQRNAVGHLKRTSGLLPRPVKTPLNCWGSWATGGCSRHQLLAGVKLLEEIPLCVRDVWYADRSNQGKLTTQGRRAPESTKPLWAGSVCRLTP